mmetsp:Transcript_29532/g.73540  ORF Transcript_29532/g.73540 Transcript_29532/m.73540 type:complete len:275 (-) Transcript_29532:999-1823(-)
MMGLPSVDGLGRSVMGARMAAVSGVISRGDVCVVWFRGIGGCGEACCGLGVAMSIMEDADESYSSSVLSSLALGDTGVFEADRPAAVGMRCCGPLWGDTGVDRAPRLGASRGLRGVRRVEWWKNPPPREDGVVRWLVATVSVTVPTSIPLLSVVVRYTAPSVPIVREGRPTLTASSLSAWDVGEGVEGGRETITFWSCWKMNSLDRSRCRLTATSERSVPSVGFWHERHFSPPRASSLMLSVISVSTSPSARKWRSRCKASSWNCCRAATNCRT